MKQSLVKLAINLCEIPSISGDEKAVALFLSDWLSAQGFTVEKIPVSPDRFNILAYFKRHARFKAIFCTHLDTVAPHIAPRFDESNEVLWGRGSLDAKGIVSSMIFSVLNEKAQGFDDLALLFTVGEEEDSDGAKALSAVNLADFLVVGEPTECKAASAQKGSVVFDIEVSGREAHSSMPHLGDSAIHKLMAFAHEIIAHPWPSDTMMGETFINIGKISGGDMRNMLANSARAEGIMRITKPAAPILAVLQAKAVHGVSLNIRSSSDPFNYFVPPGFESFVAGFGSDAPYLQSLSSNCMLIGPGSIKLAHKENEHIALRDLLRGVEAYQKIAQTVRA